jgi:2-polyprenyl-6-methoxyphenol hydroxylase-like FAD-dependent oxidoreductase
MWRFQVSHRKRSLASLEFRMDDRPLIIGAGPTGLAAALFLAIRGVLRTIDKAGEPEKESRAQVINSRSLELLEPTGVVEAMLAKGHSIHRVRFYDGWDLIAELEFGGAHPRYEMTVLPQARTVAVLTEALARRGLQPERGVKFEALSHDGAGVTATLVHVDGSHEDAHGSWRRRRPQSGCGRCGPSKNRTAALRTVPERVLAEQRHERSRM